MVALFTVSNLLHFTLGVAMVNRHAPVWKLLRSPMVVATVVGFAFALVHPPMPEWLMLGVRMVGDGMIPLMLLSLGVRMAEVSWRNWPLGVLGAVIRPLTGLAMAGSLGSLLGLTGAQFGLLLLFGSLPPAVINFMVAEQYRQEPAKVASIVLIGNVLSVVFVPIGLALALR
jgi:predicted permease